MTYTLLFAVLLVANLANTAGCGAGTKPPVQQPPQGPPQSTTPAQPVNGSERVAWDQELFEGTSIDAYEFAAYVNGDRVALPSVQCEDGAEANQFVCSASMPALRPGRNRLEFVAALDGVESERSEGLDVQLGAAATTRMMAESLSPAGARAETLATGLEAPTDLALLPDGRLLIAERRGRVRIVARGALLQDSALVLDDIADGQDSGLSGIAVHPGFAKNRFVYLGYTARLPEGSASYRVIRAREVNNTLGELATVHESTAAPSPQSMSISFGADDKLYVGIPACDDCRDPVAGTILRLNDDGSTPRDNVGSSPVFLRDVLLPGGLTWRGGQLWIADRRAESTSVFVAVDGVVRSVGTTHAGAIVLASESKPPVVLQTRPRGAGVYLFRFGSDGAIEPVSLVDDRFTVHAVENGGEGSIYLCASSEPGSAATLMRLSGW